jgi:hypothetical protein
VPERAVVDVAVLEQLYEGWAHEIRLADAVPGTLETAVAVVRAIAAARNGAEVELQDVGALEEFARQLGARLPGDVELGASLRQVLAELVTSGWRIAAAVRSCSPASGADGS